MVIAADRVRFQRRWNRRYVLRTARPACVQMDLYGAIRCPPRSTVRARTRRGTLALTATSPAYLRGSRHGNATAKAMQIYRDAHLNSDAMLALFRSVIANNRAGSWRRHSHGETPSDPPSRTKRRCFSASGLDLRAGFAVADEMVRARRPYLVKRLVVGRARNCFTPNLT